MLFDLPEFALVCLLKRCWNVSIIKRPMMGG